MNECHTTGAATVQNDDGRYAEVTLDEKLDAEPYLTDAFRILKSSDAERDKEILLESLSSEIEAWDCRGDALLAVRNQACFLLWAAVHDMSGKKLSPLVNDLPGIVLMKSFHDLFSRHMDEGIDLADSTRFIWHHVLFTLYHIAYEESHELDKGFLMLTQAFAMSEIYVNNAMWKEAQSGLEDCLNFGEDLGKEHRLHHDYSMLMGIASFYLGFVLRETEDSTEAMREYYREALEWLEPIPESFNQGIPEVIRMCRDALR